jgi:hypothetical protein
MSVDVRLLTPLEVADRIGASPDYVRRAFQDVRGVVYLPSPGKASKRRRYRVMRVPQAVLDAWIAENTPA